MDSRAKAEGPSMRTMARALRPTGVAGATIVSSAAPLTTQLASSRRMMATRL
jgi:hypothetical protein